MNRLIGVIFCVLNDEVRGSKMVEFRSNNYIKGCKSIPRVIFDTLDFEMTMKGIFGNDKDINQYLGLVLLRLGFKAENNIFLCNYNKDEVSFDCVVNGSDKCRIKLKNMSVYSDDKEIVLTRDNIELGYECVMNPVSEIGMNVSLARFRKEYSNGLVYTRYFSRENVRYQILFGDYILDLKIVKPIGMVLPLYDDGRDAKYKLGNENEVENYLVNLSLPVSVVDVYKELCELFGNDMSIFPEFRLSLSRSDDTGVIRLTDIIDLKDGNLEKFGITEGVRTIFVDKDDNWSYEINGGKPVLKKLAIKSVFDEIICDFQLSHGYDICAYVSYVIENEASVANKEVEDIKKLTRKMFNFGKGSN